MPIVPNDREVRILTKNFLDSDSTVTLSHGGTASKLYDRDKYTQYATSGAKRDTITATIDITFKIGSAETVFALNCFALINTNVKQFELQYYVNGVYVKIFDADIMQSTGYWQFGTVSTSRVRILLYSTQQPNQNKKIGELILARQRFYISQNPTSYDQIGRDKKRILELGDGQRSIAYTRFSDYRTSKYGARVFFQFLTQQDYDNLEALKNEGEPFLFYPEAMVRPDEIYYVNWVNPFTAKYTVPFKGAGYDISLELEEV